MAVAWSGSLFPSYHPACLVSIDVIDNIVEVRGKTGVDTITGVARSTALRAHYHEEVNYLLL